MPRLSHLCCALLITLTAACASKKAIDTGSPDSIIAAVNVGDEVNITSKNGKLYRFVVTRMTNKALYGDGYRVGYDEMASLKRSGKTPEAPGV